MALVSAAYGFRVAGLDGDGALCLRDADGWPELHVQRRRDPSPFPAIATLTDDVASIPTPAAHLTLERTSGRIVVRSPSPVADSDLVHPGLWPAAAVFARWRGAETLHAGAIADDDGAAWAILGNRGAGKSALLAALADRGQTIVADDLVVVDGRDCFAGPRCIDLRADTARALDLEAATVAVRSTMRRRLPLPPSSGRFALRGLVDLAWGPELEVSTLTPAESLGLLIAHRRVSVLGFDVDRLLDLAGLPALRLTRPRDLQLRDEVATALLTAIQRSGWR